MLSAAACSGAADSPWLASGPQFADRKIRATSRTGIATRVPCWEEADSVVVEVEVAETRIREATWLALDEKG